MEFCIPSAQIKKIISIFVAHRFYMAVFGKSAALSDKNYACMKHIAYIDLEVSTKVRILDFVEIKWNGVKFQS